MKSVILIVAASGIFCLFTKAQSAFTVSSKILDIGVGFGNPYWGNEYKNVLPVNPRINFEKGITDNISAGGTLAYSSSRYDHKDYGINYSLKVRGLYIGARGAYHFEVNEKLDPYAGATAGYVIVSVTDSQGSGGAASSGLGYGAFAGARYYVAGKLGLNAEVGYTSFSFLSAGVSFRL